MMRILMPALLSGLCAQAAAQDRSNMLVGDWFCVGEVEVGSAEGAVTFFADGNAASTIIVELADSPLRLTVYSVGVWRLNGDTLQEITALAHVMRVDGVPEDQAAELIRRFNANVTAESATEVTIVELTRDTLVTSSWDSGTNRCRRL